MTSRSQNTSPHEVILAAAASPASISFVPHQDGTSTDPQAAPGEVLSMLMVQCTTQGLESLWDACLTLLHQGSIPFDEITRWACTPGHVTDPKVAGFFARFLTQSCERDPATFQEITARFATSGAPMEVMMLHLAGARLDAAPSICPPPNKAVIDAYASAHGRFAIESRFGPLDKLLLDYDYKSFYLAFFRP